MASATPAEMKRLSRELRLLINEWDPIGVFGDEEAQGPADEYDCLVGQVLAQLIRGSDAESLCAFLWRELEEHFGLVPQSQAQDIRRFAEDAVRWYSAGAPSR